MENEQPPTETLELKRERQNAAENAWKAHCAKVMMEIGKELNLRHVPDEHDNAGDSRKFTDGVVELHLHVDRWGVPKTHMAASVCFKNIAQKHYNEHAPDEIKFAMSKGATKIAREIERRLLAEARKFQTELNERQMEYEAEGERLNKVLAELIQAAGGELQESERESLPTYRKAHTWYTGQNIHHLDLQFSNDLQIGMKIDNLTVEETKYILHYLLESCKCHRGEDNE